MTLPRSSGRVVRRHPLPPLALRPSAARAGDGTLCLILPEPPSANRWWRHVGARVLLSREARAYKALVAAVLTSYRITPIAAPAAVRVALVWHRGRRAGDLDKRLGVLLDAMQGTAYENDGQITAITAERAEAPGDPHVTVTITGA